MKVYKESRLHIVELRFRDPRDTGLAAPVRGTARFDFVKLKSIETNEESHSRELTRSLFADAAVSRGFHDFRTVAFNGVEDAALRQRLSVGPSAPELEGLRWETLRDPEDESRRLLNSHRIFFSRFMSGSDWRPIQLRQKSALRALVVIASPKDLCSVTSEPKTLTISLYLHKERTEQGRCHPGLAHLFTDGRPLVLMLLTDARLRKTHSTIIKSLKALRESSMSESPLVSFEEAGKILGGLHPKLSANERRWTDKLTDVSGFGPHKSLDGLFEQ